MICMGSSLILFRTESYVRALAGVWWEAAPVTAGQALGLWCALLAGGHVGTTFWGAMQILQLARKPSGSNFKPRSYHSAGEL